MIQAVILAGGRGERLKPITDSVPKPMVPVRGLPFLVHLLRQLHTQKVDRVVILAGYLSEVVERYFHNDRASPEGMAVSVRTSPPTFSGGERLLDAERELASEFLLLYGDNYAKFSLEELHSAQQRARSFTALSVFRKKPGDLEIDDQGAVRNLHSGARSDGFDFVELGYMLVKKEPIVASLQACSGNLREAVRRQIVAARVTSVEIKHPYFSVSDPQRLQATSEALSDRKVLILDRDGVLNVKPPRGHYVRKLSEFRPIEENWDAIKHLSEEGFSFIVVTNQAGLEIGSLKAQDLETIDNEIRARFQSFGAGLLDIYTCPHHWDSMCECRKPKPGLLYRSAREHNLVLDNIIFVGDQLSDREAAVAAGCRSLLVGNEPREMSQSSDCFPSLTQALGSIRRHYREGREVGFGQF